MDLNNKGIDDALNSSQPIIALKQREASQLMEDLRKSHRPPQTTDQSENKWPPMKEIPEIMPLPPTMTADMLPSPLAPYIIDSASRLGAPLECIAVPLVSAIASVIGRKCAIFPKRLDTGWKVYLACLWCALVSRPGTKKSPALNNALKFIEELERESRVAFIEEEKIASPKRKVILAKMEAINKELKKIKSKEDPNVLECNLRKLEEDLIKSTPIERRHLTTDATIEKLAELLTKNPNGILLSIDEITSLLATFEKKGREADRAFFLKAWNGNQLEKTDRIGRGTTYVPALFVMIIGGVQTAIMEHVVKQVKQNAKDGDGFVPRFQLIISPDFSKQYKSEDKVPDAFAEFNVSNVFTSLSNFDNEKLTGKKVATAVLHFSKEAQDRFYEIIDDLEREIHTLESETLYVSYLEKGRSTIPALALAFHLVGFVSGDNEDNSVSLESLELAADWYDYLKAHAKYLYNITESLDLKAAHTLAKKIKEGKVKDGDTGRDILRIGWSSLNTKERVEGALETLEHLNWLQMTECKSSAVGGRPTFKILLHPDLKGTKERENA